MAAWFQANAVALLGQFLTLVGLIVAHSRWFGNLVANTRVRLRSSERLPLATSARISSFVFDGRKRRIMLGSSRSMPRSRCSVSMVMLPYSDTNSRA